MGVLVSLSSLLVRFSSFVCVQCVPDQFCTFFALSAAQCSEGGRWWMCMGILQSLPTPPSDSPMSIDSVLLAWAAAYVIGECEEGEASSVRRIDTARDTGKQTTNDIEKSNADIGPIVRKQRKITCEDEQEEESHPSTPVGSRTVFLSRRHESSSSEDRPSSSPLTFSSSVVGTLAHEFSILSHLHRRGVACVPDWCLFIRDPASSNETLIEPWIRNSIESQNNDNKQTIDNNITIIQARHEIVDALAEIHEAGVIHADLKPEHLIIHGADHPDTAGSNSHHRVSIVDFDLACCIATPVDSASHPATFRGTPTYASIRLHLGCRPSPASDCESAAWIIIEAAMKERFPTWKLPWDKSSDEQPDAACLADPATSESSGSVEDLFTRLFAWMESQSWSTSSIHRAGHQKMKLVLGDSSSSSSSSLSDPSDALFTRLCDSIRSPLTQLLQLTHNEQEGREANRLLNNIVDNIDNVMKQQQQQDQHAATTKRAQETSSIRPYQMTASTIALIERAMRDSAMRGASPSSPSFVDDGDSDTIVLCVDSCDDRAAAIAATPSPSPSCRIMQVGLTQSSDGRIDFELRQPLSTSSHSIPPPHSRHLPSSAGSTTAIDDPHSLLLTLHSDLCLQLTRLEELCCRSDARLLPGAASSAGPAFSPMRVWSRHTRLFVIRLPPSYSADHQLIEHFLRTLFESTFLFTIPHIHIAMQIDRLFLSESMAPPLPLLVSSTAPSSQRPAHTPPRAHRPSEVDLASLCAVGEWLKQLDPHTRMDQQSGREHDQVACSSQPPDPNPHPSHLTDEPPTKRQRVQG